MVVIMAVVSKPGPLAGPDLPFGTMPGGLRAWMKDNFLVYRTFGNKM